MAISTCHAAQSSLWRHEGTAPPAARERARAPRSERPPPRSDARARDVAQAVLLVGGFSTQMRPLTLTHPLPLLEFCNEPLIKMQLKVLKDAGATHAIVCYYERHVPSSWADSVARLETELGIKITCCKEEVAGGTAGAIKIAEEFITDAGTSDAPFFVVNSDVLCTYPLRDLLHQHIRNGREGTMLTTRTDHPSHYGVVVADERTGKSRRAHASRPPALLRARAWRRVRCSVFGSDRFARSWQGGSRTLSRSRRRSSRT